MVGSGRLETVCSECNGISLPDCETDESTGPKGLAVRQLKWYVSWVQNVARQFGPYLPWASILERSCP